MIILIIYGWYELNEVSYGIIAREIDKDSFSIEDGRVYDDHDGHWFTTFSRAKKELIKEIEREIGWRKNALKSIRAMKKNDAEYW